MKGMNKYLLLLLAASICFNVFFIGGYLKSRAKLNRLKTVEGRMQLLAEKLDLTDTQEEALIRRRMQLKADIDKYKVAKAADIDAYWEEIVKDTPDTEKIDALLAATSDRREETKLVVDCIGDIMAELTPDQRSAFANMLREKNYFGNN